MPATAATRPRHRWLTQYDVHELSLVQFPDIGRSCAALKNQDGESAQNDVSAQQLGAIADLVRARISKARLPLMDQNGQPVQQDANALSDRAVRTVQAMARMIAQHKDELTRADLMDLADQMGLQADAPGAGPADAAGMADAMAAEDADPFDPDAVVGDDDEDDGADASDVEGVFPDDGEDDEDEFGNVPQATGRDDNAGAQGNDDEPSTAPTQDTPAPEAQAKPDAAPDSTDAAKPKAKPATGGGMAAALPKPAGVHPTDHAAAADGVHDAYLNNLSNKGYDLPTKDNADAADDKAGADAKDDTKDGSKKKPPFAKGKPMPAEAANKNRPDLSKLPADVREHFEMVNKSARVAQAEQERLGQANKELVEKNDAMAKRIEAIEKADQRRVMVQKTRAFKNLSDHEKLADVALALPEGEARDSYLEILKSQDAQMETVNKSRFGEKGTRYGNTNPLGGDHADADAIERVAQELITKSKQAGVSISKSHAASEAGNTPEGREAYNRMANEAMHG